MCNAKMPRGSREEGTSCRAGQILQNWIEVVGQWLSVGLRWCQCLHRQVTPSTVTHFLPALGLGCRASAKWEGLSQMQGLLLLQRPCLNRLQQ